MSGSELPRHPVAASPAAPVAAGMDGTVVGLAALVALLVTAGQALADVIGRTTASGAGRTVDAAVALVPAAAGLLVLRFPRASRLRQATPWLALAGLVVAVAGIDSRPSAAAAAASPVLVIVACRPRLGARPPRWRTVCGGVLGLAVAAGLLVVPSRPAGSGPVQLASGRVDDGLDAIGVADARFLADTLGSADRRPGARCYFVREGPGTSYADQVACGPVFHSAEAASTGATETTETTETTEPTVASPGTGAWDVYPVGVRSGELTISDPSLGQEVPIEQLRRPDRLRPPAVGAQPEVGATAEPGFAAALPGGAPDDARSASGFLLLGAGTVRLAEVAAPATVVDDSGIERRAPEGFRLAAFDLAFEDVEGATLEVVAGGQRVDVTPAVAPDVDFYQDGWVVAVVPDDGVPPVLEVTYRGRAQRLSLETGERLGGNPLLYDPLGQQLDRAVPDATIPITVPAPTPHPGEVDLDGYTITRADLTAFDPNLGWAPPGQAWLVVTIDDLDTPFFFDVDLRDVDDVLNFDPTRSFGLQPGGSADGDGGDGGDDGAGGDDWLAPAGVRPTVDDHLTVVFAVPDLTRAAAFRSAPQWRMVLGEDELRVTAPAVELRLTLR